MFLIPNYKRYGRTTYLSDYKFTIGSFSLFVTYPQQSAHTMCYHRIGTDLKYYFSLKPHSWNSSLLYVFCPLQIFCATLTLQIKVWFSSKRYNLDKVRGVCSGYTVLNVSEVSRLEWRMSLSFYGVVTCHVKV